MNMDSLSLILTVAAFIVGIMLLTGHGEIFMKGGNADVRKKLYDKFGSRDRIYCSGSDHYNCTGILSESKM